MTVRKKVQYLRYHQIRCWGCTRIYYHKLAQGALSLCNVGCPLIDCLRAGVEEAGHVSHPYHSRRPPLHLERTSASSKGWTYHVSEPLFLRSLALYSTPLSSQEHRRQQFHRSSPPGNNEGRKGDPGCKPGMRLQLLVSRYGFLISGRSSSTRTTTMSKKS